MNSRAILFVVLSTLIMMLAIIFRPAPDVGQFDDTQQQIAQTSDDVASSTTLPGAVEDISNESPDEQEPGAEKAGLPTSAGDAADTETLQRSDGQDVANSDANATADTAAPSVEATNTDNETDSQTNELKTDSANGQAIANRQAIASDSNRLSQPQIDGLVKSRLPAKTASQNAILNAWNYRAPETRGDLVTVGSLSPESDQRYLFTVNKRGATVRRVELNSRDYRGRLRYRDSEVHFGYLGSLELGDADEGCVVNVVGHGTPAFNAAADGITGGMAVGDVITQFENQPVVDRYSFATMLGETKPGDAVSITVNRGGNDLTFSVTLDHKPIELIRPEPDLLQPGTVFAESFALMLKKPYAEVSKLWESIDQSMRDGDWEVSPTVINGAQAIEARFIINAQTLSPLSLQGPIEVVKRFILPTISEEQLKSVNSKTWHWDFEVEVINRSAVDQQLGYSLVGPTGTPSETWWYANKIFGGNSFTGVAGARDVTSSTPDRSYYFLGGDKILSKANQSLPEATYIISPFETATNPDAGKWNWAGVDSQYFNVTVINADQTSVVNNINAVTNGAATPDVAKLKRLVDCTTLTFEDFTVPANGSTKRRFEVFAGPKDHDALIHYQLDDNRAFGWFWWCSKPLLWLLGVLYVATFSISYAVPIILVTILVRCVMIPFSRKAALNAQMMQALQPQMKEITEKYEDLQERGLAQRELFKKHNYQPLGGCLVMFIQLPVFLGLYRGLSADIALRDQPLIPGMGWCSDLSAPDQFLYWKDWMPAWLGAETGWLGPYLNILPLITIVLFLVQQKMFTPPAVDEQQKMMQKMMGFMMLFMGVMFFKVPSGLCLYFITSSIWGILEKKLLPKPELDASTLDLSPSGGPSLGAVASATSGLSKAAKKKAEKEQTAVEEKVRRNAERRKKRK